MKEAAMEAGARLGPNEPSLVERPPRQVRERPRYPCRRCEAGFRFQHELDKHEREEHAEPV